MLFQLGPGDREGITQAREVVAMGWAQCQGSKQRAAYARAKRTAGSRAQNKNPKLGCVAGAEAV